MTLFVVAPALVSNLSLSVNAGTSLTLGLNISDINVAPISSVLSVWITSLPSYGQLVQTVDGIQLGAAISTVPSLVSNAQHQLIYVSNDTFCSEKSIISDIFTFRAKVRYADLSVDSDLATISLTVVNPLVASVTSASLWFGVTNSTQPQSLILSGSDALSRSLTFIVSQLPRYGSLYSSNNLASRITSVPFVLSAPEVYYALTPYPYSSGISSETITRSDWFGYTVSVIGSTLQSPVANVSLVSSTSHTKSSLWGVKIIFC